MKALYKISISLLVMFTMLLPTNVYASEGEEEIGNEQFENYYAWGHNPAITVLDNGVIVAIHQYNNTLHYQTGIYTGDKIEWSTGCINTTTERIQRSLLYQMVTY